MLPFKINGELQHGWSPNSGVTSLDLNSTSKSLKLKRYYLFNKSNKKKCLKAGYNNVMTIGAPFLYLDNKKIFYEEEIAKSLILYPTHSHEWFEFSDPVKTYKKYVNEIKKIMPIFTKVTVSLGWKEYRNKKIIDLFIRAGISVVTSGHRDDNPYFLHKFIKNVNQHEYVSSDSFSSAVFYSLFLKKKVFIYGGIESKDEVWKIKKNANHHIFYSNLYPQILWDNFDHKSHHYISDEELGLKYKKSPEEICDIFEWNFKNIF
tara:strand:+ start:1126 stop:1911 length:786 start_codon:yes stop_codon:yes gene_type:complete